MTPYRRVPTGLLAGVATAVLGLGGTWWIRSAPDPAPAPPAARSDSVVIVQLDNGAMLAVDASDPRWARQFGVLDHLVDTEWPCVLTPTRIRGRDLRRALDSLPPDGTRIIRLPRCAASRHLNVG